MTKEQLEVLKELIAAMIANSRESADCYDSVRLIEAEDAVMELL